MDTDNINITQTLVNSILILLSTSSIFYIAKLKYTKIEIFGFSNAKTIKIISYFLLGLIFTLNTMWISMYPSNELTILMGIYLGIFLKLNSLILKEVKNEIKARKYLSSIRSLFSLIASAALSIGGYYAMYGSSTIETIIAYISLTICWLIIEFEGKINQSNTFGFIAGTVIKTKTFKSKQKKKDRFL